MKKDDLIKKLNYKFLDGIAHRGLHTETITENSIEAFKNALLQDVAIELDVHLSKDKELIVCHDANLKRTTGKEGIIEDLTLKEIKDNYLLLNKETVPTLKEVLNLVNEEVPLVIELKPDTKKKNYKELAYKVIEELKVIKDKKNIMIISFYPQCLFPIKKEGYARLLLVNSSDSYTYIFRNFFEGVDLDYTLFNKKKYQKSIKKRLTISWTIDNLEKYEFVSKYRDTVTYQYIDPKIIKRK